MPRRPAPEPQPPSISILPVQLQVGDRYTDEAGEWEVVSRSVSFRGGKGFRARVHVPGQPATEREDT